MTNAVAQKAKRSTEVDLQDIVVTVMTLACISFSCWAISIGWNNSIFDYHGFRQAQTAINSYCIMRGGSVLQYETPVLGPPWSIPFEFPLYQWLVVFLARSASLPLESAGRSVAAAFYFLSFIPLADILRSLQFKRRQVFTTLALFAISPFYIFHSRCFMIESTALFWALCYIAMIFRLPQSTRPWLLNIGIAVAGVIAGMVKVTTFASFFVVGAVVVLRRYWKTDDERILQWVWLASIMAAIVIPFVATAWWTSFADVVKSENPMALQLTSKALKTWNFGTLEQRLVLRNYTRFPSDLESFIGSKNVVLVVFALGLSLCRAIRPVVLACVALYVGTIELFFNLHYVHQYYAYSNAIFVVVAVGVTLGAIIQLRGWPSWLGVCLFVAIFVECSHSYFLRPYYNFRSLYQLQAQNAPGRQEAANVLAQSTRPEDVIVIFGLDWSPELPYQAHRRAIMDPTWNHNEQSMAAAIDKQGKSKIAAIVACDWARSAGQLHASLEQTSIPGVPQYSADGCDIYLRESALRK